MLSWPLPETLQAALLRTLQPQLGSLYGRSVHQVLSTVWHLQLRMTDAFESALVDRLRMVICRFYGPALADVCMIATDLGWRRHARLRRAVRDALARGVRLNDANRAVCRAFVEGGPIQYASVSARQRSVA